MSEETEPTAYVRPTRAEQRARALARFREVQAYGGECTHDPDTGKPSFVFAYHPEAWLNTAFQKWKPELATMDYKKFLVTGYWKAMRNYMLAKEVLCESCDAVGRFMHVHHKTYEHVFDEPLFDLVAICKPCHDRITAASRARRAPRSI